MSLVALDTSALTAAVPAADADVSIGRLPFFIYGTLRHGQGNYAWALNGRTCSESAATLVGGAMYDGGGFPFVLHTGLVADAVRGEVMHVIAEDYQQVLSDLDRLEGYRSGAAGNLYERVTVTVTADAGEQVGAWTYVASGRMAAQVKRLPLLPSGDWVADGARFRGARAH